MIQSILAGKKTQTRRIIKYQKEIKNPTIGFSAFTAQDKFSVRGKHEDGRYGESFFKMPYCLGEILWVRETIVSDKTPNDRKLFFYKADIPKEQQKDFPYFPSIYMPKSACRIFLKITSIKVERLNQISESDAICEGVERRDGMKSEFSYKNYVTEGYGDIGADGSFETLWQKINGVESWNENPFVWVITFEKTTKPYNF